MLQKKIQYTDYDNNKREETFFFNLSKAELTEMNYSMEGGLEKLIQKIIETVDEGKIVSLLKELILKSYGEKSPDGKRFIKSAELREAFSQTEAYVELYMELLNNPGAADAFIRGILPVMAESK